MVAQAGAFIHHGAAMEHQLLHSPGGAVLRRPHRQFGMVGQQQVGQKVRVLGVILGAAGGEGFPILLERDGVDGMQRDPSPPERG